MKPKQHTLMLAVTGLSPQIVTETVYALLQQGEALPDEIHLLSTLEGCRRAQLTLINDGWLARLYHNYQHPYPEFSATHIHILQDSQGQALTDIRTQADNQAMADCITEWIRLFTAQPDTALHVSIAGGRKTMGFYAGYALSLYGRSQDRLSHVLISPEFESHPQFYYPTPYSQVIYGNDATRKPLDTQHAEVMLADIAFVRLRHGLDKALLEGKTSFSASVAKAQQALDPAELSICLKTRRLTAQGIAIKLMPVEFAFYLWLLERQQNGLPAPHCPSEGAPEPDYAHAYLQQFSDLASNDRTVESLKQGMPKSFFEQRKSRINKILTETLQQAAKPYLISPVGKRPRTGYWIHLAAEQIHYQ
jgi:CRISPR-associated protein (TIGR02584 family)